jgi:hypothetical protein
MRKVERMAASVLIERVTSARFLFTDLPVAIARTDYPGDRSADIDCH